MSDIDREIARLQAEIAAQEAQLTALEAEVLDLRHEVGEFEKRYNRIVLPLETRLDAVKSAIHDLEAQRYATPGQHPLGDFNPQESHWVPPEDYVSVEEQFRRTWTVPPDDGQSDAAPDAPTTAKPKPPRESNIKKLYRALARRYHPDLAADPETRAFRNDLMARINEAYAARDIEALQALANQPENARLEAPLAALRLQELRQITLQLARRIEALQIEKAELQFNDLMRLSLEEKLARSRGRDLLAEIALRLEREYDAAMIRLEQLRRQ
jgi:hypothetical protein